MIIVSQDKKLILNFENIEAIGIGNPLEDDDGMFKVLASTTSDNEYTIGKYSTEKRAKEVLQNIAAAYSDFKYYSSENGDKKTKIGIKIYQNYKSIDLYEMPVEKVDDK